MDYAKILDEALRSFNRCCGDPTVVSVAFMEHLEQALKQAELRHVK